MRLSRGCRESLTAVIQREEINTLLTPSDPDAVGRLADMERL